MTELQQLLRSNQDKLNELTEITKSFTVERREQYYHNWASELKALHYGGGDRNSGRTNSMLTRAFKMVENGEKVIFLAHTATHIKFLRVRAKNLGFPIGAIYYGNVGWKYVNPYHPSLIGYHGCRIFVDHHTLESLDWEIIVKEFFVNVYSRSNTLHT